MFANDNCARLFASQISKNLCALAIKSFAELDVRRNRLLPPISFDVSIFSNITHVRSCHSERGEESRICSLNAGQHNSQRCFASLNMTSISRREFSRCIKFRVNAAAGQEFGAATLFDDTSVIEHDDLIKIVNGRQPMRGNQRRATAH